MTKEEWVAKSEQIRKTLGAVISRKLGASQQMASFPGLPDGSYFEVKFDSSFAGLKAAVETVSFSLEKDGQWKAVAYLISPFSGSGISLISVNCLGEIKQPGSYRLPPDGSLLDALAAAGGWTPKANLQKAAVLRPGAAQPEIHDISAILQGKAINPMLGDRDIVTFSEK